MSTKTYSNKQEKLIADALGWQVVSASGARNFHPGDIKSPKWLGECKTHISETSQISFKESTWMKLEAEADSEHKDPAYFVDNGSQSITGTWVMFDYKRVSGNFEYFIINSQNCPEVYRQLRGQVNVNFDCIDMLYAYRKIKKLNSAAGLDVCTVIASPLKCNKDLVICPLSEFIEVFGSR
jgi:hypothetical protein|nr:MAG TPA: hypothetical protein [Caudoviricetes sp.]